MNSKIIYDFHYVENLDTNKLTGLNLSIIKKFMEEHSNSLQIQKRIFKISTELFSSTNTFSSGTTILKNEHFKDLIFSIKYDNNNFVIYYSIPFKKPEACIAAYLEELKFLQNFDKKRFKEYRRDFFKGDRQNIGLGLLHILNYLDFNFEFEYLNPRIQFVFRIKDN